MCISKIKWLICSVHILSHFRMLSIQSNYPLLLTNTNLVSMSLVPTAVPVASWLEISFMSLFFYCFCCECVLSWINKTVGSLGRSRIAGPNSVWTRRASQRICISRWGCGRATSRAATRYPHRHWLFSYNRCKSIHISITTHP